MPIAVKNSMAPRQVDGSLARARMYAFMVYPLRLFVLLVVELFKYFGQHLFDLTHVVAVVFAADIGVGHGAHVGIQPVN